MVTQELTELLKGNFSPISCKIKRQTTLPAESVSVILHEPAILDGYRVPHQPWKYYFFSLFQLHNETVNVWTHLIGAAVILYQLYGYFDEFDVFEDHVLATLIAAGTPCVIGLLTSAVVHLVHSKSSFVHFIAFMMDYIGATFFCFGAGIAMFYGMSHSRFYNNWKDLYLLCLTLVSYVDFVNLCLAKIFYGHDPHNMRRKYMLIGGMFCQVSLNMLPCFPSCLDCFFDENCSLVSLYYPTIIVLTIILMAFFFAAHQPERIWPGKFDVVGHGHQVFHVLVVISGIQHLSGIYSYYKNGLNHHGKPSLVAILFMMILLYIADVLTLLYLKRYVPECIKRAKDITNLKEH